MSNDNVEPRTLRDQNCYVRLITSFSGPILDNAPVFESKADVADTNLPYTVIASTDGSVDFGILMSELFITSSRTCADGSITGRTVLGKVRVL